MQKQIEILTARFGKLKTDFKLGSVLNDYSISKQTGNTSNMTEKTDELSRKLAEELSVYKDINVDVNNKLIEKVLNSVKDNFDNTVVEVPKYTEITIPEILTYYIERDVIRDIEDKKLTRSITLRLPKDTLVRDFLVYGDSELETNIKVFLNDFTDDELNNLYMKYFSNVSKDNRDIDKLLACRLDNSKSYLWKELLFVFVTLNALIRKDNINEVTSDVFSGTLQLLRNNVIRTIHKNTILFENFINDEIVISYIDKDNKVVIGRNLNKAFDKDLTIEVIYGAFLLEKNFGKKISIKDLKDQNLVYTNRWKKEYDLKVLEIRNDILRGFKTILSKVLIEFIEDSDKTLQRFGLDKEEVKNTARKYIVSVRDVSEDNIGEICYNFVTKYMYKDTGLNYFISKIEKYKSKKYGFDIAMSINLAVNEVCAELLVQDLIIKD